MLSPEAGPFPNYEEFFDKWFSRVFARTTRSWTWCSRWQDHPEAVVVMQNLWVTWEFAATTGPDGMAVWLRDFAYPLLDRLTVQNGTFAGCNWSKPLDGHDPSAIPLSRS